MTNKERYKQAFSPLHASEPILLEGTSMEKTNKRFKPRPALAAGLAAAVIVSCMGAAYAADLGGIQEKVRVWFGGKDVEATVVDTSTDDCGAYEFTMIGPDGEAVTRSAGGTAIGDDGTQRPLSAEEIAEGFATEVVKKDDGTVWIYDHDQAFDVTGYLADGQTKFTLEAEGKTVYYDIFSESLGYTRLFDAAGPLDEYVKLG